MMPSSISAKGLAAVLYSNLNTQQYSRIWLAKEDGTDSKAISVVLRDVVWCVVLWCEVVWCGVVWCDVVCVSVSG